jgi:hypothetical protein
MVNAEVTSRCRGALQAERCYPRDESGGAKASLKGRCLYHGVVCFPFCDSASFRRLQGTTAGPTWYTTNHIVAANRSFAADAR